MTGQALVATDSSEVNAVGGEDTTEFVTFNIAGQLFGIPVLIVQDILLPESIASIPLAPPEVRGSINLRGRIVTVIDVRIRLGLERRAINAEDKSSALISNEQDSAKQDTAKQDSAKQDDGEQDSAKQDSDEETENTSLSADDSAVEAEVPAEDAKRKKISDHMMAVTVEHHNELYTLLVDSVGDVIPLSKKDYEGNPGTLDPVWREFAGGVYRLENKLMVVLDVDRLLDFSAMA